MYLWHKISQTLDITRSKFKFKYINIEKQCYRMLFEVICLGCKDKVKYEITFEEPSASIH
jgi:hypothetical protein